MSNCSVYRPSARASDRTVVLAGLYIAQLPDGNEFSKVPNPLLWEPGDTVKQQGYVVQSVTMDGAGTQNNSNIYYVIMSK
jgi:hypothetical protein